MAGCNDVGCIRLRGTAELNEQLGSGATVSVRNIVGRISLDTLKDRLVNILDKIELACMQAGRIPGSVALMAVSKTRPYEDIISAYSRGQVLFGENRVQEVLGKVPLGKRLFSLHLIGHLQSNKASKAVEIFDGIDSLDSLKLANLVSIAAVKAGRTIPVLLEFNTSGEDSKSGFQNEESLYMAVEGMEGLPGIKIKGLMTIGPLSHDEIVVRKAFARLASLQQQCYCRFPNMEWSTLSMGMSGDFPWAIQEGSTIVRIGTALFGERQYP